MSKISAFDDITVSQLNTIAEAIQAKKYGIISSINIDVSLASLIEEIFKDKSILLFQSDNPAKLLELENIFSDYLSSLAKGYFRNRVITDEIELLKSAYQVNSTFFIDNKLKVDEGINEHLANYVEGHPTELFEQYYLTRQHFLDIASSSKTIEKIDNKKIEDLSLILATNRIEYNATNYIVLSVITQVKKDRKEFKLRAPFLFRLDQYSDMELSPSRLFLKLLDFYGMNITIYGTTKRFWEYVEVSNYVGKLNRSEIRLNRKLNPMMFANIGHNQFVDRICFFFGINYKEYIEDLNAGAI